MKPAVSVTMAVASDFHRPEFTLQCLRNYQTLKNVEFIFCDNHPNSPEGKALKANIAQSNYLYGTAGLKYIPLEDPQGTSAPRETAIRAASAEIVMNIDSHILLLDPKALSNLVKWFEARPKFRGIVSGPIYMDNLHNFQTHFNPMWRGGMFGVWGETFEFEGQRFSTVEVDQRVRYVRMDVGAELVDSPLKDKLPDLAWAGHEQILEAEHFCKRLGRDSHDEIEVPGQGLGLFAFRKATWPGFNPLLRGFGGEELYIHEKFRRNGGKALCLGFLSWWHSFGRPRGVSYTVRNEDKVRNNVLTHLELGWDIDVVKEHFIGDGLIPGIQEKQLKQEFWDKLMEDPTHVPETPKVQGQIHATALVDVYAQAVQSNEGYFSRHMPFLYELAKRSKSVVEISRYAESSLPLAMASEATLTTFAYAGANSGRHRMLRTMAANENREWTYNDTAELPASIPDCDLLVYVMPHCHEELKQDLTRWLPNLKGRVAIHDTHRNGVKLDCDGKPGYFPQIKDFLDENPNWFITQHHPFQSGMTFLSCIPEEKPEKDIIPWPIVDGVGAAVKARISDLGVNPGPNCTCNKLAHYMNMIGVDQVEKEFDDLKAKISENWKSHGLVEKLEMVGKGVLSVFTSKTPWQLPDKKDPVGSLLRLGIADERARLAGMNKGEADGK